MPPMVEYRQIMTVDSNEGVLRWPAHTASQLLLAPASIPPRLAIKHSSAPIVVGHLTNAPPRPSTIVISRRTSFISSCFGDCATNYHYGTSQRCLHQSRRHCVFQERGFRFTHEAVRDWEQRFAPLIATKLKAKRRVQHSEKWRVDETYIKVNGKQHYLYRAVDGVGTRIDMRLSATRDMDAAVAFFEQARKTVATKPKVVITDKHASYPKAIRKTLGRRVEHRQSKYLNNRLAQDHRGIKQRIAPMGGFKRFESAKRFCSAYDEQRTYFRYRAYADEPVPLWKQRSLFWQRFSTLRKEFMAAQRPIDHVRKSAA